MKILHTADFHANSNYDKFLESSSQIKEHIINEGDIDLMVFSGDLFDSRIFASHQYNKIVEEFSDLANYVPIFMVYGTPSHDYKGSLAIFEKIKTKYEICVIDNMKSSFIWFNSEHREFYYSQEMEADLLLIGCPWTLKSRWLTDKELKELTPKEQNEKYEKRFNIWREKILKINKDIFTILVGHLQLIGSIPGIHQDISSENHNPKLFYDLCDYGALGHIHNSWRSKNLYYSGSIFNKTWGELEDKYFNVVTIENKKYEVEKIKIKTPVMLKIDCNEDEYKEYKNEFKCNDEVIRLEDIVLNRNNLNNIWFNIETKNKNSYIIENEIEFWNKHLNEVRLEFVKIKTDTLERLEEYSKDISLEEKFKIWCKQKKEKPTEFQLNKIKELE